MLENAQSICIAEGIVEYFTPSRVLKLFSWRRILIVAPVDFKYIAVKIVGNE